MQNYTMSWQDAITNKTTTILFKADTDKDALEKGREYLSQAFQAEGIKQIYDEISSMVK